MLYSEIIAVCSQIHTKHIHTLCGQNVPRSKHRSEEHTSELQSRYEISYYVPFFLWGILNLSLTPIIPFVIEY
jgi:hypothetical protein